MIPKSILTNSLATYIADSIAKTILKNKEERTEWEDEYWNNYIKMVDPWEKKFIVRIRSLFEGQKDEILGNMGQSKSITKQSDRIDGYMFDRDVWERRFHGDGEKFITGMTIESADRATKQIPVIGMAFDVKNPETAKLLKKRSKKFAREINDTTEKNIRRLLATGIDEGESMPKLRNRIGRYFDTDAIPRRAQLIARTETIWASNAGAEQAYMQSGVVEGKEWLIAGDERTCPFCFEAYRKFGENNAIKLGETFYDKGSTVEGKDGSKMTVSYENVQFPPLHVSCRCVLIPRLLGEMPTKLSSTGNLARSLSEAESKIAVNDFETLYAFAPDGKIIFSKVGEKRQVRFTKEEVERIKKAKGAHLTHNHPGYSNSFSVEDIQFAIRTESDEMRAVSKKYLHIMNLDTGDIERGKEIPRIKRLYNVVANDVDQKLRLKVISGKIGIQEANEMFFHECWERLDDFIPYLHYKREIRWRKQ